MGAVLIWYYLGKFSDNQIDQIIYDLKNANYSWIMLSLVFGALSHLSRAYRWHFMLEPIGYKPRFANSVMAVLVAYLLNLVVPRSGEIGRAATMSKYEDIPFEKGFGTIVAERVSDVIMLLLILGVVFFLQTDLILDYFSDTDPVQKIILLSVLLIASFVGFRLFKKSKNPILIKIRTFIKGLIEGMSSVFKMKKKWPFVFHTFFIWAMYVLMFWVVTFTIPETSNLSFEAILVGFIAGAIAMSITNGGFGAYPVFVAQALVLYGINQESGTSFGLLMWASQTLMVLTFGGLSFLMLPIYNKEK